MGTTGRRVVLATFGSLGDLHPYLAIAREIAARGHLPVVATTDYHADAVRAAGIEFAAVAPAADVFPEMRALVQRLFHPLTGPRYMIREVVMPHVRAAYADLHRIAADADVLVSHPLTMTVPLVAAKRGLPWASTVLAPFSLMSAVDPPAFAAAGWLDWIRRLGPEPYRAVLGLIKRVAGRWEAPLAALRREIGLPPASAGAMFEGQFSPHLNLAMFSRVLAAPQPDWPAATVVCGFPRWEGDAPDPATAEALAAFLAAGDPPIVFTLGSSVAHAAGDFFADAVEAARRLGRRALLITGADEHAHAAIADGRQVRAFRYLPYGAVFPHARAIVHQGGIGTLAQALASGRPQLVLPVAFDQPDNARRAQRCGVARALPWRRVRAASLAEELAALLRDEAGAHRAARVATDVRREEAARVAADHVLALIRP